MNFNRLVKKNLFNVSGNITIFDNIITLSFEMENKILWKSSNELYVARDNEKSFISIHLKDKDKQFLLEKFKKLFENYTSGKIGENSRLNLIVSYDFPYFIKAKSSISNIMKKITYPLLII